MSRIHRNSLLEHVEVDGAQYIGNGKGFDLFRILNYNAAQEFVVNGNNQAGAYYTHDEDTFNHNINDAQKLYFFTNEDTNIVKYAIVKSSNTHQDITFNNTSDNYSITTRCNFLLEDENYHAVVKHQIPLFILNTVDAVDVRNALGSGAGVVIGGQLLAVLGCLDPHTNLSEYRINEDAQITSINEKAFTFGISVTDLVIDKRGVRCPESVENVNSIIRNVQEEEPEQVDVEDVVNNDNNDNEEDIEIVGDTETHNLEGETETQRGTEQTQATEYPFIYKVVGNEVHIVRGKNVTTIDIPDEIDGKPVTTIEAYAFSGRPSIREIRFPKNLKKIERGAFLGTNLYVSTKQQIKKIRDLGRVFIGKDII